jgi:hypothetical protein
MIDERLARNQEAKAQPAARQNIEDKKPLNRKEKEKERKKEYKKRKKAKTGQEDQPEAREDEQLEEVAAGDEGALVAEGDDQAPEQKEAEQKQQDEVEKKAEEDAQKIKAAANAEAARAAEAKGGKKGQPAPATAVLVTGNKRKPTKKRGNIVRTAIDTSKAKKLAKKDQQNT